MGDKRNRGHTRKRTKHAKAIKRFHALSRKQETTTKAVNVQLTVTNNSQEVANEEPHNHISEADSLGEPGINKVPLTVASQICRKNTKLKNSTSVVDRPKRNRRKKQFPDSLQLSGRPQSRPKKPKLPEEPKVKSYGVDLSNDAREEDILFRCSACFFTSQDERNYLQHVHIMHKHEMGYWCKDKIPESQLTYVDVKHKARKEKVVDVNDETQEESIVFECAVCMFMSYEEQNYFHHVQNAHKHIKGYWCKWCGKSFLNPDTLVEHVKGKCPRERIYLHPCGFAKCDFVTKDPYGFTLHWKLEHKKKYLMPCALCEKRFTIMTSLILHLQEHCVEQLQRNPKRIVKENFQSILDCAACLFRTNDPIEFTEHHNDRHKREVCCCKYCGQAFVNVNLLLCHLQEPKTCPKEKYFDHPCGVFGCSFTDKDPLAFINHIKSSHAREPLYPCGGCQMQFLRFPLLVNHIQQECFCLNRSFCLKQPSSSDNRADEKPARTVNWTYDNQATEHGEVEVSDVEDQNECVDDGATSVEALNSEANVTSTPVANTEIMEMEVKIAPQFLKYDWSNEPDETEDLPMIVPTAIPRSSGQRSRGIHIKSEPLSD